MNRNEKQTIIDGLGTRFSGATSIYVTDFTGLNVAQVTELRRRLRKAGVTYLVVKNTLAHRALEGQTASSLQRHLTGGSALAFATDAAAAAKVLVEFAREHQKPSVKGGVVDGREVTPEQVRRLATLPSREVLLAELGAAMQAPMAGFLGVLQALLSNFAGALEALKTQREGAA